MTRPPDQSPDPRTTRPAEYEILFRYATVDLMRAAIDSHLADGGVYCRGEECPPTQTPVVAVYQLQNSDSRLRFSGEVALVLPGAEAAKLGLPAGMSIRYQALGRQDRARVEAYINEMTLRSWKPNDATVRKMIASSATAELLAVLGLKPQVGAAQLTRSFETWRRMFPADGVIDKLHPSLREPFLRMKQRIVKAYPLLLDERQKGGFAKGEITKLAPQPAAPEPAQPVQPAEAPQAPPDSEPTPPKPVESATPPPDVAKPLAAEPEPPASASEPPQDDKKSRKLAAAEKRRTRPIPTIEQIRKMRGTSPGSKPSRAAKTPDEGATEPDDAVAIHEAPAQRTGEYAVHEVKARSGQFPSLQKLLQKKDQAAADETTPAYDPFALPATETSPPPAEEPGAIALEGGLYLAPDPTPAPVPRTISVTPSPIPTGVREPSPISAQVGVPAEPEDPEMPQPAVEPELPAAPEPEKPMLEPEIEHEIEPEIEHELEPEIQHKIDSHIEPGSAALEPEFAVSIDVDDLPLESIDTGPVDGLIRRDRGDWVEIETSGAELDKSVNPSRRPEPAAMPLDDSSAVTELGEPELDLEYLSSADSTVQLAGESQSSRDKPPASLPKPMPSPPLPPIPEKSGLPKFFWVFYERLNEMDYFDLLQLNPVDVPRRLKQAYHRLSSLLHPDLHRQGLPGDRRAVDIVYRRITEAYAILKSTGTRQTYRELLAYNREAYLRYPLEHASQEESKPSADFTTGEAHFQQGLVMLKAGDLARAEHSFRIAVKMAPMNETYRTYFREVMEQRKNPRTRG